MRKLSFLAMMFMALSLPMTMVSCGDDDEPAGEQGGPGGEDGNKDDEGGNDEDDGGSAGVVQLDSIRQKMILEETANELLSRVDAADFRVAAGLLEFVDQNSADGSDISKWADAGLELCCANATDSLVEMVYSMSNFCGRFELRDGRWLLSPDQVGYLEFNFTDGEKNINLIFDFDSDSFDFALMDVSDESLEGATVNIFDINSDQTVSLTFGSQFAIDGKGVFNLDVDDNGMLTASFKKGALA